MNKEEAIKIIKQIIKGNSLNGKSIYSIFEMLEALKVILAELDSKDKEIEELKEVYHLEAFNKNNELAFKSKVIEKLKEELNTKVQTIAELEEKLDKALYKWR